MQPSLLFAQAQARQQQGLWAEAAELYRQVLVLEPQHLNALSLLGLMAHRLGRNDIGLGLVEQALGLASDRDDLHVFRGALLRALGRDDDAVASYEQALALAPDSADAWYNLGNLHRDHGRLSLAAASYGQGLVLRPQHVEGWNNLCDLRRRMGDLAGAIEAGRHALELDDTRPETLINLGAAYKAGRHLTEAASCWEQAIALDSSLAEAHSNLGNILVDMGRAEEAAPLFERALALAPDSGEIRSNWLFSLNYRVDLSADEVAKAHHSPECGPVHVEYGNSRDPERRLRVGYVSPDFRTHSCAYFLEPLLANHRPDRVEIFCYSDVAAPDELTARFQAMAQSWRSVAGLPHHRVAAMVAADSIDILVDLAGHTDNNRLPVFARKPAPVQVSWLGYPHNTGLTARMGDAITDPHDSGVIQLETGFLCYAPGSAPDPVFRGEGPIVFGSFNTLAKLNDRVVELWAELLQRVPESGLLLKAPQLRDEFVKGRILECFARKGINSHRLELVAWAASRTDHLATYHRVDVALDPFPYCGTTTTCEALWMGVPVVTLAGDRHCARVGASLVSRVGLGDLVAAHGEDYLRIAASLAADVGRLKELRHSLRQQMAQSPLCDGPAFAAAIEGAYRRLWRDWCSAS